MLLPFSFSFSYFLNILVVVVVVVVNRAYCVDFPEWLAGGKMFNPMCAGEATDGRVIRSYFRMNDFVLLLSSRSRERERMILNWTMCQHPVARSSWPAVVAGFFFHPFGLVFWVFCLFPFLLLNDCPAKFGASFKLDWTIRLEGMERRESRSIGYKALPSNYHLIRQQCCSLYCVPVCVCERDFHWYLSLDFPFSRSLLSIVW